MLYKIIDTYILFCVGIFFIYILFCKVVIYSLIDIYFFILLIDYLVNFLSYLSDILFKLINSNNGLLSTFPSLHVCLKEIALSEKRPLKTYKYWSTLILVYLKLWFFACNCIFFYMYQMFIMFSDGVFGEALREQPSGVESRDRRSGGKSQNLRHYTHGLV